MPFPEGLGINIKGAKKARLVGEEPDPLDAPVEPRKKPAPVSSSTSHEVPRGIRVRQPQKREAKSQGAEVADSDTRGGLKRSPSQAGGVVCYDIDQPPRPQRYLPGVDPEPGVVQRELAANTKPFQRSGRYFLQSTNIFGLASRSETFYPEMYKPVSTKFWEPLTDEEHAEQIRQQAAVQEKVQFRDHEDLPVSSVTADAAYNEAQSRRYQALKSRRRKRGYEGKKQVEELRKLLPLQRRYVPPETTYRKPSDIFATGPLDTPVLVPGYSAAQRERMALEAPPEAPKPIRGRRRRRGEQPQEPEESQGEVLPEFSTVGSRRIKLKQWANAYGLTSRAVAAYPEAYREVYSVFWRPLTDEQRQQITTVQAQAMEKVGFERGTQKHFIQDFDPSLENRYGIDMSKRKARSDAPPAVGGSLLSMILFLVLVAAGLTLLALVLWPVWEFVQAALAALSQ